MSNESLELNIQRIVRLKEDYIKLCSFLEFKAQTIRMERLDFYNEVFRYSLDHLRENGFTYVINKYDKVRKPKGISISYDVSDDFDTSYNFFSVFFRKKFRRKLHLGEFVELILYIYSQEKLTDNERNLLIEDKAGYNIDYGIEKAID